MEPRKAVPGVHSCGPRVAAGSGTAAELVYHLAGALGTELKELARRFGPEAAARLVPLVVRALELLEKAAVGPDPDSLQVSAQQAEAELRRLREENERLRRELRSGPQEERALLRQLKEVTDRQRDELRAHSRDLQQRSQETEALQEQLQRLLLVNAELRHKLAAVQTQLRAARDRERERELQSQGAVELARDRAAGAGNEQRQEPERATADAGAPENPEDPQPGHPSKAGQCSFSREELEQILQERNELKANVFLLKEELAYFQRELLTDHRVPGLLVEAMKVAVKKQRKKIKAKMLGIPEEAESRRLDIAGFLWSPRALMNDPHISSLLFPASVTMKTAHGSCSPVIREPTLHPLSPEYKVSLACPIRVKQRPPKPRPAAWLPVS
ncbi:rab-interacting lysosomal protein isoform X3 [Lutra lutra]|uniref:rab-interacting lysosomal protein isoform X3 n=1 Tax=Lutra lutra TaxID=9657 RepID=UPI001FD087D6|nr:rab-interacting lysosomal protein isoform X3 [Lutra lutra]